MWTRIVARGRDRPGKRRLSVRAELVEALARQLKPFDPSTIRQTQDSLGQYEGPYEDLEGFLHYADEVAESFLSEGITAMKIWMPHWSPFARSAMRLATRWTSWRSFTACGVCPWRKKLRELKPFYTFWHEDAFRMDSLELLKQYAKDCDALICASETLSYKWGFKDFLSPASICRAWSITRWASGVSLCSRACTASLIWLPAKSPMAPMLLVKVSSSWSNAVTISEWGMVVLPRHGPRSAEAAGDVVRGFLARGLGKEPTNIR